MDENCAETDVPRPNGLAGYRDFWVHKKLLLKHMELFDPAASLCPHSSRIKLFKHPALIERLWEQVGPQQVQQAVNPGCLQAGIQVQIRHIPGCQDERLRRAVCTQCKDSIFV